MARAGGIRAGRAFVELFLDQNKLTRGLNQAGKRMRAFGRSVGTIGASMAKASALMIAPFALSVKHFSSFGDNLQKMSKRTGVSVESLSALAFAANRSGASMESVEKGIRGMQRSLLNGERGLTEVTDSLEFLNLTVEDFQGLSPEEQFIKLAEALSEIEDPSLKAGLAMKLLGRSGSELLPLFEGGEEGIAALVARAKELGLVMSKDDADAAALLSDRFGELWEVFKMGAFNVGAALADTLTRIAKAGTDLLVHAVSWIKENQTLILSLARLAVGVGVLGIALISVGLSIGLVGFALSGVSAIIGFVMAGFSAVLSPIGLVVVAILAASAALLHFSGVGGMIVDFLGEKFRSLWDGVKMVFAGIQAAMAKGDFGLAADIMWGVIQIAFAKGSLAVQQIWGSMLEAMLGMLSQFISKTIKALSLFEKLSKFLPGVAGGLDLTGAKTLLSGLRKGIKGGGLSAEEETRLQAEIDRLEAKLSANIDAAKSDAEEAFLVPGTNPFDKPGANIAPIKKIENSAASVAGTFSGFDASLLGRRGGQKIEDKQLAVQEEMRDDIGDMLGELKQRGPLVWGK